MNVLERCTGKTPYFKNYNKAQVSKVVLVYLRETDSVINFPRNTKLIIGRNVYFAEAQKLLEREQILIF